MNLLDIANSLMQQVQGLPQNIASNLQQASSNYKFMGSSPKVGEWQVSPSFTIPPNSPLSRLNIPLPDQLPNNAPSNIFASLDSGVRSMFPVLAFGVDREAGRYAYPPAIVVPSAKEQERQRLEKIKIHNRKLAREGRLNPPKAPPGTDFASPGGIGWQQKTLGYPLKQPVSQVTPDFTQINQR